MSADPKPPTEPADGEKRRVLDRWYGYQVAGLVCLLAIPVVVWLVMGVFGHHGMRTALVFLGLVMVILVSEAWYDLARWRRSAGKPTTHGRQLGKIAMTLGWVLVVVVALVLLVRLLTGWKPGI